MQEADGGYLFLDEVHRLSYEKPGKCFFVFMDTGRYRPLGDKKLESSEGKVYFCDDGGTGKNVLLENHFRRRITVQTSIGSIAERPLMERLQLIYRFYQKEAVKINKDILIEKDAMQYLCFFKVTRKYRKTGKSCAGKLCGSIFLAAGEGTVENLFKRAAE